ncbi:type I-E CRISPR-associated protein Cse1/CasA [Actinocorallia sp. API 0066]|uniref:type I-E CRISPR-associated protein Cse1/CasA n=1 Tax=Actinocorallia sp. API 0066 TaxID=2896846 RepID=UPI001E3E3705|nr:type I-E CRISPR-associated protein Cse1/CasA [Actinocorallia sp. API 0066]MCD0452843.1 type I-E CRISPR-associated protein Cse1/CasA [Actinocorallia sp. API 0066]
MRGFDLTSEGWIPLLTVDGGLVEVGVAQALVRAETFTEIVTELPTQVPALLRQVLLPIVADALGLPESRAEWERRFTAGRFTGEEKDRLLAYLEEHCERFDLLGDQPFGQVADLEASSGDTKGAGLMVAVEFTGNNVPLYGVRTEADPPALTLAEAVRWLLHLHCWDTAAIKTGARGDAKAKAGKTTGNPTGPLGQLGVVVPVGRTLYETLLLNLPIKHNGFRGEPQWRRPQSGPQWEIRPERGLLDLWTWQSRRVHLFPEETPDGLRVRRVVVAAGDRLQRLPEWEPHTAWKYDKPPGKAKLSDRKPLRHQPGKAIWRGMDALLALELAASDSRTVETSELLKQAAELREEGCLPEDYPLRVEAFGITYGNQSAVIENVYHDSIPLPLAALQADAALFAELQLMASQAEQLARAVNYLSADLRRASGLDPIPWDKGQRPGERVLHLLDPVVRLVLRNLRSHDVDRLDKIVLAWESRAYQVARKVADMEFATLPESVFAGRSEGDKGRAFGIGNAEAQFRRRLGAILPTYRDNRPPDDGTGDEEYT